MKIGRFLKYFAGAVVVLLVAAVVVLAAVDFNDYKSELQAQVKQATGVTSRSRAISSSPCPSRRRSASAAFASPTPIGDRSRRWRRSTASKSRLP